MAKRKQFKRRVTEIPRNLKCRFCETKTVPSYIDYKGLRNSISERAKIIAKIYSGVCNKHQRMLEREVKRARYLGLIPYEAGL